MMNIKARREQERARETAVRARWAAQKVEEQYLKNYAEHIENKMAKIDAIEDAKWMTAVTTIQKREEINEAANRVNYVEEQKKKIAEEKERLMAVDAARWAGVAILEQHKKDSQTAALELLDLSFDPYVGMFADDLINGSLTSTDMERIQLLWNDARRAYDARNIDLQELARTAERNPLVVDDIYFQLTAPVMIENVLVDRSSHKPYQWFLSGLDNQLGTDILTDDTYMQFEANYLNALMEEYPTILKDVKLEFAKTYVSEYSELIHDKAGEDAINLLKRLTRSNWE